MLGECYMDTDFNTEKICKITNETLNAFDALATSTDDGKYRFCLHETTETSVQELINVWPPYTYFQPHKHPFFAETKVLLEGRVLVLLFDESGSVTEHIIMDTETEVRILRLAPDVIHTNIALSKVIFLETTPGPFIREKNNIYLNTYPQKMTVEDVKKFIAEYV